MSRGPHKRYFTGNATAQYGGAASPSASASASASTSASASASASTSASAAMAGNPHAVQNPTPLPYASNLPYAPNHLLLQHLLHLQNLPAYSYLQNPAFLNPPPTHPLTPAPTFHPTAAAPFSPSLPATPPPPRPLPAGVQPPRSAAPPPSGQRSNLERAQAAAKKVRDDLVLAGESVTGWKVAQGILAELKADSWTSLGLQVQEVPALRELFLTEGKVNTFIHCYVAARAIVSLYDLEADICKNEGIEQFEELGLGPLSRHPLVIHYFSAPPDMSEVPRFSTEEIIGFLQKLMDKSGKKVTVDEFLNYLAKQKSVSAKEKLGVRIRSLGLHISFLRQARRDETLSLKQSAKNIVGSNQRRNAFQDYSCNPVKRVLDQRFDLISRRVTSLFSGKHVRFDSSDDEIDADSGDEISSEDGLSNNSNSEKQSSLHKKDVDKRVSSCPYPSTAEEMKRLGLKSEKSKSSASENGRAQDIGKKSGKKRKFNEENGSPSSSCKHPKTQGKVKVEEQKTPSPLFLSIGKLEKFITTWKEACSQHSVEEALELFVNYYAETPRQTKKMTKFFSEYPGIALLNVAVRCMGGGLFDSLYDIIHVSGMSGPSSATTTEIIEIDPPCKENAVHTSSKLGCTIESNNEPGCCVTVDDVIKKVTEYFISNCALLGASVVNADNICISLNILHDCEMWVNDQFLAKQFTALGHGTFLGFLEKYASLFPPKLSSLLNGKLHESSSLEVFLTQQQIEVLLCQAESSWQENGAFAEDDFIILLKKQFPTICFDLVENKSGRRLVDCIKRQKESRKINNLQFSVSLLDKRWSGIFSRNDIGEQSGSVSSLEAMNCLQKAPMLSDLLLWSHWDLLYAPSLGSFVQWLLNTNPVEELSCIVTRDGRFIRIESSATVDQFLEAIIQFSPFQVALKLLSLLHMYNGSSNAPISLLKCYAQQAIDVIMTNNIDPTKANSKGKNFMHEEPQRLDTFEQYDCSSNFIGDIQEGSDRSCARNTRSESLSKNDGTVHYVAKFILECLGHLPSEFWSLAADILLAAVKPFSKNFYSAILHECTETYQRCMLHDIGLSLGVAEWVNDYHDFCSTENFNAQKGIYSSSLTSSRDRNNMSVVSEGPTNANPAMLVADDDYVMDKESRSFTDVENKTGAILNDGNQKALGAESKSLVVSDANRTAITGEINIEEAACFIENIRCEEFGLGPNLSYSESCLLKKQHARLGRALHCLSQELYSQDSHLLLELIQNADDNTYFEDVEPTVVFILQENGVVILNNEKGFSPENIRALCDIGNSTKKGLTGGYIGNKGIGFKSVFRVTDAPEIHSNGFHVKFDITEGQIGFVLPTVVSPFDVSTFNKMVSVGDNENTCSVWNTCILLPFRSKFTKASEMCSIVSMFSDLHPSLLLFLHRLKCIKFKNMLDETLLVMRKSLCDGIVKVSHGNETMSWLVVNRKLQGSIVRHDVRTTEIALAFTLQENEKGEYQPYLKQQPVFAFLPLRNYGLKFILQADFVLPSSREEVDADSAWNQWLLSEFPSLFVSAQETFCALPCFQKSPGKAVTAFMNFVPLGGEVHGFFSQLPHLIISKLRATRCMILEGPDLRWVYPCNVLRGWDEQARILLSDDLIHKVLGLGYLSKDIIISDALSRALGIQDHGPKFLTEVISSMCRLDGCIKSMGMEWLCAWLVTLHSALLYHSSQRLCVATSLEGDILCSLKRLPFIPLSDGSFSSVAEGQIWLPYDVFSAGPKCKSSIQDFPILYANLRTVSPLLSVSSANGYLLEETRTHNLVDMLLKIGVRKLSAHEIIRSHVLASLSNVDANTDKSMMIEYLSFIMLHLQSPCTSCDSEKAAIMSELRTRTVLLTNHGYKCPADKPIHFGKDYGNSVDIEKLLHGLDFEWIELDTSYLRHHSESLPFGMKEWRKFFEELGVTDFVQVVLVEKTASRGGYILPDSSSHNDTSGMPTMIYDWESPELARMLSIFSSKKSRQNSICLLEVLDKLWDDFYSAKARSCINANLTSEERTVESSFIKCIRKFKWIASSMDEDLHYAMDLFYDCHDVRSLLGGMAPYAVPKVSSKLLWEDLGFKTEVLHTDALMILNSWMVPEVPFSASVDQMCRFYTFISEGIANTKISLIPDFLSRAFIFTPLLHRRSSEVVPGKLFSPKELYWHDPTGCSEITKDPISIKKSSSFPRKMLSAAYPSLHEFFTEVCGVPKVPTISGYLEILLRLSNIALPSRVATQVFHVFVRWANDLHSGTATMEDILYLKESLQKLDTAILPTWVDKWVSLHPSFGLVCWADDDELKQQFKDSSGVDFIQFGELTSEDKQMLFGKVAALMQTLGIPALSKVVSREAIFYGTADNREIASLIDWLLPYMQRYIYKIHTDTYFNFKQNEIEKLSKLQVIIVEKLFHTYTLKGRRSSSKRRSQCSCLLQGNILYALQDADPHSVLLELSRLFFDGSTNLHFANFLHMVKTMAESGSTQEQIEFFIVNCQNVPELPGEESRWSFYSLFPPQEGANTHPIGTRSPCELNFPRRQMKPGIISSWPPTGWRTAPDLISRRIDQHGSAKETAHYDVCSAAELSKPVECGPSEDTLVPIEIEGDWILDEGLSTEHNLVLTGSVTQDDEPQIVMSVDSANEPIYLDLEPGTSSSPTAAAGQAASGKRPASDNSANFPEVRDRIGLQPPDENQKRTGRLGEAVVYKYFLGQRGSSNARWVNEGTETGLPYDIVITNEEDVKEYVEVKATSSPNKDWFHITFKEWQFAREKGDSFCIAHIALFGPKKARIIVLKNPYKLCQQRSLGLAIIMSRQHKDSSVIVEPTRQATDQLEVD